MIQCELFHTKYVIQPNYLYYQKCVSFNNGLYTKQRHILIFSWIAGLPKDLLFGHHGKAYSNNMISLYDEYYNRRARPDGQKFPPVRSWDSKSMTWVPEKIDHPLQGVSLG